MLPDEIILCILQFTPNKYILYFGMTCKANFQLIQDNTFWASRAERDFGVIRQFFYQALERSRVLSRILNSTHIPGNSGTLLYNYVYRYPWNLYKRIPSLTWNPCKDIIRTEENAIEACPFRSLFQMYYCEYHSRMIIKEIQSKWGEQTQVSLFVGNIFWVNQKQLICKVPFEDISII